MSATWHEYNFPKDISVHLEQLKPELREGATTTPEPGLVTCPGCLDWFLKMNRIKGQN